MKTFKDLRRMGRRLMRVHEDLPRKEISVLIQEFDRIVDEFMDTRKLGITRFELIDQTLELSKEETGQLLKVEEGLKNVENQLKL